MSRKIGLLLTVGTLLTSGTLGMLSLQAEPVATEVSESSLPKAIETARKSVKKWAKNDADVLEQASAFLDSIQSGFTSGALPEEGAKEILKAARYVAKKHQAQTRANSKKTPYLIHLLGVADQLMRIAHCYDAPVIVAALLHDTIENTEVTYEEIGTLFGPTVMSYVKEMTEDPKLPLKERKKLQIVHAFHQSKEVALIKMSDKLHNLQTLMKDPPEGWTQKRIDDYFLWAQAVVDNFPSTNEALKQAFHQTIEEYWEHQ